MSAMPHRRWQTVKRDYYSRTYDNYGTQSFTVACSHQAKRKMADFTDIRINCSHSHLQQWPSLSNPVRVAGQRWRCAHWWQGSFVCSLTGGFLRCVSHLSSETTKSVV